MLLHIVSWFQVTTALNWLVRMVNEIENNIVAVERINDYSEKTDTEVCTSVM